jgi:hypothetical protein
MPGFAIATSDAFAAGIDWPIDSLIWPILWAAVPARLPYMRGVQPGPRADCLIWPHQMPAARCCH